MGEIRFPSLWHICMHITHILLFADLEIITLKVKFDTVTSTLNFNNENSELYTNLLSTRNHIKKDSEKGKFV